MRTLELCINQPETIDFYRDVLGMEQTGPFNLRYANSIELAFSIVEEAPPHNSDAQSGYWKIGLTLPDVGRACQIIRAQGVQVSQPKQFLDIGYLTHLRDPEGLPIELLAHRFHGKLPETYNKNHPLGSQALIGQVTLRISDPERSLAFYVGELGMKLLSVQPVPDYQFTLYFLAYTDEEPPNSNLEAVENREWLWQRRYTTLELQHRWGQPVHPAQEGGVGYKCLVLNEGNRHIEDPDGHLLRV